MNAYDEAEAALESLMTADAALHSGAGSSTDGAGGKRGKGHRAWAWLDVYRDFMKGKKGGKGPPSIDEAQDGEGAPNLDDAEYEEEEEEEEEVVEDNETSVEVELEVIQEEEEPAQEEEEGHQEDWHDDPLSG